MSDGLCIHRIKRILNNCIQKEVGSILEVIAVMGVRQYHHHGHTELGMLDASKEEADLLCFVIKGCQSWLGSQNNL